tara:strand:- start:3036 stop:4943 length:1908 start_codon:yes stop_codon:yes gene_type:complete
MPHQIVIAEQLRIAALLTDERVDELIVAQGRYQIGDVFLGTVENVLPGIDAAFVNIGESEKNGFIHITDLGPLRLKKGAAGITELLEPRQKVLVQVMKEPTGTKGPRLTGNLALPGRYLVLQPHGQGVNISRRINSEAERNRLRALGVLIKPPGAGLLIRTEANEISEELLIDDLENLLKQWDAIQQTAEEVQPPVLLNRDEDFIHRILRDHLGPNLIKVVVENELAVDRVNEFLSQDDLKVEIEAFDGTNNLLEHYKINQAINDALRPRVDLPSGGYIIIEPTEALTVIDVNSGSFTRSSNSRETVLWTNCEAAIEIARQLKLRNIGGVIIIDFIDMESRRDQLQLLEHFTSAIKNDSSRPQIAQLTELGLVELTRKRQGQNIYELFGKSCENCGGLGLTALIPGQDTLQPMAVASGLVKSISTKRSEIEVGIESKLKKSIKTRESDSLSNSNDINNIQDFNENEEHGLDTNNSKNEPKLVGVRMNLYQEEVYSLMGLDPVLLLDKNCSNDNLIVRIVRDGDDETKILEEAKNQLSPNSIKRRRKGGKNTLNKNINKTIEDASQIEAQKTIDIEEKNKDIIEQSDNNDIEDNSLNIENDVDIKNETNQKETIEDSDKENDDPRRRRRRSSAIND